MRYIGYEELEPRRNFPLLKESLEEKPYAHKQVVLDFLRSGTVVLAKLSRSKDVISGELIPVEDTVMHDGDFYWSSVLVWYVEKYNLRLPADFEQYILSRH